jgi:DNA (cytosine-5)-methyltransferase 1
VRFGSLFAGVGGFDLGFERAGLECAWQVEIEPACGAVLKRHWPDVQLHADVRQVGRYNLAPVDVVCGGFPCQDLSVAGARAGLAGERSGLFYEMARIVDELRPLWVVWENVPGLFTSNGGRDFAAVLSELDRIGYGGAWTVLDARYFGLAQRRRRIFGVFTRLGAAADRAAEVLALSARVRGYPPPRSEARAAVASPLGGGSGDRGRRDNLDSSGAFVALDTGSGGPDDNDAQAGRLLANPVSANEGRTYTHEGAGNFRLRNVVPEVAWALQERDAKGADSDTKDGHLIPFDERQVTHPENRSRCEPGAPCHTLHELPPSLASRRGVRRLTPLECERLQGFPDGWTEGHADAPRYRMMGNAVPPPVARWIGSRLPR